ncbi:MAG: hypothetical protein DID92_2727745495 [Candidatus Nitrotoga sp. SPKER]|nr:MAG: hypothetical protein DID92_2727745495 [Candidatus Nitrotoga sp. SPKER]
MKHHHNYGLVQRNLGELSEFINVRVDEPREQAIITFSYSI